MRWGYYRAIRALSNRRLRPRLQSWPRCEMLVFAGVSSSSQIASIGAGLVALWLQEHHRDFADVLYTGETLWFPTRVHVSQLDCKSHGSELHYHAAAVLKTKSLPGMWRFDSSRAIAPERCRSFVRPPDCCTPKYAWYCWFLYGAAVDVPALDTALT